MYRHQARCHGLVASALFFAVILLVLPLFTLNTHAGIEDWVASEAPPTDGQVGAVCLYNLDIGLFLYEKNAEQVIYPTSAVKIMTGLIACRELASRTEETVTITADMLAGTSGRNMGLASGEEIRIFDLMMAAFCGGYNDACAVLAHLSAGSIGGFVDLMNREAEKLGAQNTHYTNVTGLHDPSMVTTAKDTALIAREATGNTLFMSLVSAHVHTIPANNIAKERTITNRNALVSDTGGQYYNGWCRGMNAGMTDEGGWCVITLWEKNGSHNVSVVMQGVDVPVGATIPAYSYTNRLLSWAGRCYGFRTVLSGADVLDTVPVADTGISKSKTDLLVPEDVKAFLPTHVRIDTDVTVTYHLFDGGLTAPLSEGQVVGSITVTYGGEVVGSADLLVNESFERNGFLNAMGIFKQYLLSRAFLIALLIFLLLLVLYLKTSGGVVRSPDHLSYKGGRYKRRRLPRLKRYRRR